MAHEVIMPALGMAQETGLILAWHKQPGEAVAIGDVLMEVETDKAAMEVEAQAGGFLTDLRAAAGEEVPVGTVIAVISANADDTVTASAPSPSEAPAETPVAAEPSGNEAPSAPPAQQVSPVAETKPERSPRLADRPSGSGKVLASPKAKRLAAERGIVLETLAEAGIAQPIRTADLDRAGTARVHSAFASERLRARASVNATAFDGFCKWASGEAKVSGGAVLATFAAGSFRSVTGATQLCVTLSTPGRETHTFEDPDRCGLVDLEASTAEPAPDLIVYDLTATRLTDADLAAAEAPTLTIVRDGDRLSVSIVATGASMDDAALIAFLDAFAGRLEEPLRQLL